MKILFTLLITIFSFVTFSQTDTNFTDKKGLKQGLWIEKHPSIITETYYKDNLKNGVYKSYYTTTGKLYGLGEYKTNKPIGKWLTFDESGHLWNEETNIEILINDNKYKYKSYVKYYDKFGNIEQEGSIKYFDSMLDGDKDGLWKFNKDGKTSEKTYLNGRPK